MLTYLKVTLKKKNIFASIRFQRFNINYLSNHWLSYSKIVVETLELGQIASFWLPFYYCWTYFTISISVFLLLVKSNYQMSSLIIPQTWVFLFFSFFYDDLSKTLLLYYQYSRFDTCRVKNSQLICIAKISIWWKFLPFFPL